jgi:branched-chain amino acid transport system substrate-binding protein
MSNLVVIRQLLCVACLATLFACHKQEPVRIGFVGGLTGKAADLGVAGRNGVQLAVEQRNAAGGINGRQVELIVKDDEQNPETAKRVLGELIGQNLELIIGPMTSSMAMALMPQINASKSILLSPDVTTSELSGKDDNFLRVCGTTSSYAAKNARVLYDKLGIRSVAVIYDINNKSYSESWLNDFRTSFTALGGKIILVKSYLSSKDTIFFPLAKELLTAHADSVVIISNAVDSAQLCQHIRKLAPTQRISMSEWASTERFMELAGTAAEGVVVAHFLDRNDKSQRFQDFMRDYRARFNQDPGFSGVTGYDAGLVAMEAFATRTKGHSIKDTIIAKKSFQGIQPPLNIDRFGDADRKSYVSVIKGNQYIIAE